MSGLSTDEIDGFAQRLDDATLHAKATPMLSKGLGEGRALGLADAYAIQRAGIALRKLRADDKIGMKMGLTSRAKMVQMGVHEPIYGHLTRAMLLEDGGQIERKRHIHPRIEPEVAFLLDRELRGPTTPAQALAATGAVCAALEIIDSRYEAFQFTLADVVADNASSSRFVLGARIKSNAVDVANLGMVMEKNGRIAEIGSSAAILDHPARSLAALANQLAAVGEVLPAGSIVMAGGATAAIPLVPGDRIRLRVDGLGALDVFVVE